MLVEALLIIVSILLAFGIDAWWEERRERIEEHEILLGLKQEFEQNQHAIESQVALHEDTLGSLETLLRAIHLGHWESGEITIDKAIQHLNSPPTTDLGSGVLSALLSAGRLSVISNKQLRLRLAAWESVFSEALDDEIMARGYIFSDVIPYLIEHGVPLSGTFEDSDRWPVPHTSVADDPAQLNRLLTDPSFKTLIEARYGFKSHATEEYESVLVAIDEILGEIGKSLDSVE